ncbi:sulfotransferase [Colwellia sp. 75C3]|uniref:sulfotransferase n=1 Tax=Colwellia sp. 75C3 TaxID=888425 RepID=UPI0012FEA121|nr:sulfotransferase [Colwellia sp. 75C3]
MFFLLSLPRSGSTYVQNLMANNILKLNTGPEPWVLPFVLQWSDDLTFSHAGTLSSKMGVEQYSVDINSLSMEVICRIYNELNNESSGTVFLDKTPRNLLYWDFIKSNYQLNKSLVLIRNPYDIVWSYYSTFRGGELDFSDGLVDFNRGASNLLKAIDDGATYVRYEDVKKDPKCLFNILKCLNLNVVCDDDINTAKINEKLLTGVMGDPKFRGGDKSQKKMSFIAFLFCFFIVKKTALRKIYTDFYSDDLKLIQLYKENQYRIKGFGFIDLFKIPVLGLTGLLNIKIIFKKYKNKALFDWIR